MCKSRFLLHTYETDRVSINQTYIIILSYYMTNREAVAHNSILSSVLEAYGHTPLIKLSKIAEDEGLECDICELHENFGSV